MTHLCTRKILHMEAPRSNLYSVSGILTTSMVFFVLSLTPSLLLKEVTTDSKTIATDLSFTISLPLVRCHITSTVDSESDKNLT